MNMNSLATVVNITGQCKLTRGQRDVPLTTDSEILAQDIIDTVRGELILRNPQGKLIQIPQGYKIPVNKLTLQLLLSDKNNVLAFFGSGESLESKNKDNSEQMTHYYSGLLILLLLSAYEIDQIVKYAEIGLTHSPYTFDFTLTKMLYETVAEWFKGHEPKQPDFQADNTLLSSGSYDNLTNQSLGSSILALNNVTTAPGNVINNNPGSTTLLFIPQENPAPPSIPVITTDSGNPANIQDTVFEAGLPNIGSQVGQTTTAASGTFTLFNASGLDALQSVSVNSNVIPIGNLGNNNSIVSPTGIFTITGYDSSTGVATYTFQLTSPAGHEGSNFFYLTATDGTNTSLQATIEVDIANDRPIAQNDLNQVKDNVVYSANGNVIGNDIPGADGVGSIAWTGANAGVLHGAHGTLTLGANGSYTYILNVDPVVKALDDGQSLTELFNYRLTDGDGDSSLATLTININGTNDAPTIITSSGNPGNTPDIVYESGLANGSHIDPQTITANGTFTFSDPDGLSDIKSVTINGNTILINNLGTNNTIASPNGVLTITGYNSSTGVATYSYTLKSPASDGPGTESNIFTLTTSDGTVSSAPASIIINIVDDVPKACNDMDVVTAKSCYDYADGNVITGVGGTDDNRTDGTRDINGADGFGAIVWKNAVNGVLTGAHGTLTVKADGSYSYHLNNADPAVIALNNVQSMTETFTYTLYDGDGDASQATLTILINGVNDAPTIITSSGNPGNTPDMVYESGLANGSHIDPQTITANGTFTLSDPDGLSDIKSVTINFNTILINNLGTNNTIASPNGVLTITGYNSSTGVATYSYTLNSPAHDGPGTESNIFTLTTSDGTVSSAPASIIIDIVDDVPKACNDMDVVTAKSCYDYADGNVITGVGGTDDNRTDGTHDITGADGFGDIVWKNAINGVITGAHGTLTVKADGSYSYHLNNADPAVIALNNVQSMTETFTHTLYDGDGDASQATLTILINGVNDAPTIITSSGNPGNTPDMVYESGLANGSHIDPKTITANGTFTLSDPDGLSDIKSVTINGNTILINNLGTNNTIASPNGVLTITGYNSSTGVATYSYTLNSPAHDGPGTESNIFTLTTSDGTISSAPASIIINIVDDVPKACNDMDVVTAKSCYDYADGNVITGVGGTDDNRTDGTHDITGADGFGDIVWKNAINGVITGAHGTLAVKADGSYSYHLNNADPAVIALNNVQSMTETFTYTLYDGDGDASQATLTILINGVNDAPTIITSSGNPGNTPDMVYESGLANGSHIDPKTITANGTFTLSDPDGLSDIKSVTINGNTILINNLGTNNTIASPNGVLTITGYNSSTGDATYSYTLNSPAHDGPGTESNIFTLTTSDGTVSSAPASIIIDIVDDVPVLGAFENAIVNNQGGSADGNFAINFGADGPTTDRSGDFLIIGPSIPGVVYKTQSIADGTELIATLDGIQVFTLEVFNDGHYTFNLIQPPPVTTDMIVIPPGIYKNSVVIGQIEITGSGPINASNGQGWGIANNRFNTDESFTISSPESVEAVTLRITDVNGTGIGFLWKTGTESGVVMYNPALGYVTIDPTNSFNQIIIQAIDTNGKVDSFRIESIDVSKSLLPADQPLNFQIAAIDGDGDKSNTSNLSISFDSSQLVTPVVLDLNNDGFTFVAHDAPSNQVLFDYNNDQRVNNGSEIIYSDPAKGAYSDLQGLELNYDTNADGYLDKNDANSNGISDPGEFSSLTDSGITSINLQASGNSYTAANGEVIVNGESTFTWSDGSTGQVADVGLTTYDAAINGATSPEQHVLSGDHSDLMPLLAYFSELDKLDGHTGIETSLFHDLGINMDAAQIKEFLASIMDYLNVAQQGNEDMKLDFKAVLSSESSHELDLKSLDNNLADATHKPEAPVAQPVEASAADYIDKAAPANTQAANADSAQLHPALAPIAHAETPIPPVVHVA